MAFTHRKLLVSYLPGKDFNVTIYIPFFETYSLLPPPPQPQPQRDLSFLVSTTICILGSVLLFLFLVVVLYLYLMQARPSSAAAVAPGDTNRREDENEAGKRDNSGYHDVWRITTAGLHRSAIDSITVVGFKKGEGIIDGTECSVCLNEFEENESLRLLPKCSHAFHINCIDTWLLSHKNCPLCRAPILHTEPRHQETESNHVSESGTSNDFSGDEVGSGFTNLVLLSRSQSDLANHSGSESLETVRRSFSIGGSTSLKAGDSDDIAPRSGRHFYTSFSANFFSPSRKSRNQEPVLPNRMPSLSGLTG